MAENLPLKRTGLDAVEQKTFAVTLFDRASRAGRPSAIYGSHRPCRASLGARRNSCGQVRPPRGIHTSKGEMYHAHPPPGMDRRLHVPSPPSPPCVARKASEAPSLRGPPYRAHKHADAGFGKQDRVFERYGADEQAHREPDLGNPSHADQRRDAGRQRVAQHQRREPCAKHDSQRFADEQAQGNAQRLAS